VLLSGTDHRILYSPCEVNQSCRLLAHTDSLVSSMKGFIF